jgi:hypothetical protein
MALLKRSLVEYFKYFSLNMPMFISACAIMSSVFNRDLKGYIFVGGALILMGIGALLSSSIGGQTFMVPKSIKYPELVRPYIKGFNAEACNIFSTDDWGLIYSSPEAHALFLSYAFTYITAGMFFHGDYNFPLLTMLTIVLLGNAYVRTMLKCGGGLDIIIGWSLGLLWGAGLYAGMYFMEKQYDNGPSLTYFSGSDGADKCKITNRKFKCKKYARR